MTLKNAIAASACLSGAGKAGGRRPSAEAGREGALRPQVSATPSLSLSDQSRTQNKEASKLLPSPPPQTSLLSGVLYEVIKREYFSGVSWVPGASQWPSKPRRGGNRGARWEVLAQAHTAGSGEARMLISVSWLLPIPFPKKGERSNGASSPSGTCIAPWLS